MQPKFLNIDLEIRSKQAVTQLLQDWAAHVVVLCNEPDDTGIHYTTIEIAGFRYPEKEEDDSSIVTELTTMQSFDALIQILSPIAREEWEAADITFDIGYELNNEAHSQQVDISTEILQLALKNQGRIRVTVYKQVEADHSFIGFEN